MQLFTEKHAEGRVIVYPDGETLGEGLPHRRGAVYFKSPKQAAEHLEKMNKAGAILEAHPGGAVSMDREELEKEALFTVSATNFYDLGDNIENTTDEELERIIAADGDESKEGAA